MVEGAEKDSDIFRAVSAASEAADYVLGRDRAVTVLPVETSPESSHTGRPR